MPLASLPAAARLAAGAATDSPSPPRCCRGLGLLHRRPARLHQVPEQQVRGPPQCQAAWLPLAPVPSCRRCRGQAAPLSAWLPRMPRRCVECQPIGWDLHPARHICVKCWRTNCAACDARRPAQCLRCRDGYYRSSAGLCKKVRRDRTRQRRRWLHCIQPHRRYCSIPLRCLPSCPASVPTCSVPLPPAPQCKARCTSCLNRSGWCVDCMEPYYPHQGRCVLEVEDPLPRDPKLDQEPY